MKPSVYVESSVVGYFAARPSRDIIVAARQQTTREWWETRLTEFEVFVSVLVLEEIAAGDSEAARERLNAVESFKVLELEEDDHDLARLLIDRKAIPKRYVEDALHIAVSANNGIGFLVTWNFAHINNAERKWAIEDCVREFGVSPPTICSPEELMGGII
jgi:predicted nucleic acid-binding protein